MASSDVDNFVGESTLQPVIDLVDAVASNGGLWPEYSLKNAWVARRVICSSL